MVNSSISIHCSLFPQSVFSVLELWDLNAVAAFHGGIVGAEADHCPIGAGRGIGEGGLFSEHGLEEIVDQVRMTAAMAAALEKREVVGVLNRSRLREAANGFGEAAGVIGNLRALGDFGLGLAQLVQHG